MLRYYGLMSVGIAAVLLAGFLYLSRSFYIDTLAEQLVHQAPAVRVAIRHGQAESDGAGWDAADLEVLAREVARGRPLRVTLIAGDGRVLADSETDAAQMDNHRGRPEVAAALQGDTGTATRYSTTLRATLLYVALPVDPRDPGAMVVRVAVPVASISEAVGGFWREVILLVFVVALLTTTFVAWIARSLSEPLERLRQRTVAFQRGERPEIEPVDGPFEVQQLGAALHELARNWTESLRQARAGAAWLRAVLDSMPSGVLVLEADGRVAMINDSAARLLGVDADEVSHHHYIRAVSSPELRQLYRRCLAWSTPTGDKLASTALPARGPLFGSPCRPGGEMAPRIRHRTRLASLSRRIDVQSGAWFRA